MDTVNHYLETRSALPIETRNEAENDPLAEATQAVEELRTAAEERHTAHQTEIRGLTTRLAAMETRLNRPGTGQTEQRNEPTVEQRAFGNFLRHGQTNLTAEEQRTLQVGQDPNGGFLVPDGFVAELLRDVVNFSPVRQYARVMTVAGANVRMPKRTANMTAQWVAEIADRPETEPRYGEVELTPYEAACWTPISNQLLEDSAFDMESELRYDAAEEFGRLEGQAFVRGDGIGKPKGFLTDTTIGTVASGVAGALGDEPADKLIALYYALNSAYRRNGTWAMNSRTLAALRSLKDGNGTFLWSPGLAAGQPETLLGRPVIDLPDMPDVGANALPVVFGDFSQGYRIVDRTQLQVLRDPYTLATRGQTRFHFRRRVGGGVVKAEAFKALKIAVN